jgi:hypothetical protein
MGTGGCGDEVQASGEDAMMWIFEDENIYMCQTSREAKAPVAAPIEARQ